MGQPEYRLNVHEIIGFNLLKHAIQIIHDSEDNLTNLVSVSEESDRALPVLHFFFTLKKNKTLAFLRAICVLFIHLSGVPNLWTVAH